jgi:hypothetical protein
MSRDPSLEGREVNTISRSAGPLRGAVRASSWWGGLLKIELSLGNSDSLSSEQARIHGPCAGTNHCEGSAQSRQENVHRTVDGGEKQERQFGDRQKKARHGRPKPDCQERRTDGGQKLEDDGNGERRSL